MRYNRHSTHSQNLSQMLWLMASMRANNEVTQKSLTSFLNNLSIYTTPHHWHCLGLTPLKKQCVRLYRFHLYDEAFFFKGLICHKRPSTACPFCFSIHPFMLKPVVVMVPQSCFEFILFAEAVSQCEPSLDYRNTGRYWIYNALQ